jgi:hypothetical protein
MSSQHFLPGNKNNNSIIAYFSNNSVLSIDLNNLDKINWVKFNNIKLKNNGQKKFYSKTEKTGNANHSDDDENDEECNLINFNSKHWIVKGKNTIPDMNFIYNGTLPTFSISNTMLRDTLKRSDTLFITINNLQNADSIRVFFADNDQQTTRHYADFVAPNYTNNYYIIPSVFASLVAGSRGLIKIEAVNYTYQTIAGKQFLFRNIYSFTKPNIRIIN